MEGLAPGEEKQGLAPLLSLCWWLVWAHLLLAPKGAVPAAWNSESIAEVQSQPLCLPLLEIVNSKLQHQGEGASRGNASARGISQVSGSANSADPGGGQSGIIHWVSWTPGLKCFLTMAHDLQRQVKSPHEKQKLSKKNPNQTNPKKIQKNENPSFAVNSE